MSENESSLKLDSGQLAAQKQFDRHSAHYGKSHKLAKVDDVEAALSGLKIKSHAEALDVATGGGHTGIYLAEQGIDVTLSDLSTGMLEKAAALARERHVQIILRQHVAEKLPYNNESFDLVICRVAAHHFSSPQAFVSEAARILRNNGYFIVIDNAAIDSEPEASRWLDEVEKARDPSHQHCIAPQEWKKWVEAEGLQVIKNEINLLKMEDLEWHFEVAGTSPENRDKTRLVVASAPASATIAFKIEIENEKIAWFWHRLTFVAQKK